jgi:hypothetical protein
MFPFTFTRSLYSHEQHQQFTMFCLLSVFIQHAENVEINQNCVQKFGITVSRYLLNCAHSISSFIVKVLLTGIHEIMVPLLLGRGSTHFDQCNNVNALHYHLSTIADSRAVKIGLDKHSPVHFERSDL